MAPLCADCCGVVAPAAMRVVVAFLGPLKNVDKLSTLHTRAVIFYSLHAVCADESLICMRATVAQGVAKALHRRMHDKIESKFVCTPGMAF